MTKEPRARTPNLNMGVEVREGEAQVCRDVSPHVACDEVSEDPHQGRYPPGWRVPIVPERAYGGVARRRLTFTTHDGPTSGRGGGAFVVLR